MAYLIKCSFSSDIIIVLSGCQPLLLSITLIEIKTLLSVSIFSLNSVFSFLPKPTIMPEIITAEIIMPTTTNTFFILNLN